MERKYDTAKKCFLLLLAMVIIVFSVTFFGTTAFATTINEKEPNNNFYDATVLQNNSTVLGKVGTQVDALDDFYVYKATKKGYVQFSITTFESKSFSSSILYSIFRRKDIDEKVESGFVFEKTTENTRMISVDKGDLIYIRLDHSSYSEIGYSISAKFTAPQKGETWEKKNSKKNPSVLKLNKKNKAILNLIDNSTFPENDYFKFTAKKAGKYRFKFNHGKYLCTNKWVINIGTKSGKGNILKNWASVKNKTFTLKLKKKQTIYIKVSSGAYGAPASNAGKIYYILPKYVK